MLLISGRIYKLGLCANLGRMAQQWYRQTRKHTHTHTPYVGWLMVDSLLTFRFTHHHTHSHKRKKKRKSSSGAPRIRTLFFFDRVEDLFFFMSLRVFCYNPRKMGEMCPNTHLFIRAWTRHLNTHTDMALTSSGSHTSPSASSSSTNFFSFFHLSSQTERQRSAHYRITWMDNDFTHKSSNRLNRSILFWAWIIQMCRSVCLCDVTPLLLHFL